MLPKVMLLMALCGLFLKNQMQGALGQESTMKSFWKDLDQELEERQAAKAAARTDARSTGTGMRNKSEKNATLNMPADDEEWKFILCTTLMTTATLGSKQPDQTIIKLIKDLCPKLEEKLNKTLPEPNELSSSLDKLMYKLQDKIKIKEEQTMLRPSGSTKVPGKPSGEIITPKPSVKPDRKTRGVRAARDDKIKPNNDEFKTKCEKNVTDAKNDFQKQIDRIKTKFDDSMKSYAFFAQRKSDFHGEKSSFVNYTTPEILYGKDENFNNSTGQFTAPVHGQYYLKFQGVKIKQELSKTYNMTAKIVKKDGDKFKTLAEGHIYTYDYYSYFPIYVQATVVLIKGDVVGVQLEEGWLHEFGTDDERFSTSFTGFLIKEIITPLAPSMPQKGCSPCASRT